VVTSPVGWLALVAIGVLIVAGILWGFLGNVAIKVQGQGILIRGEAVRDVTYGGQGGRLEEVLVDTGDVIAAGQAVATVNQPELALRIENTQEELEAVRKQTILPRLYRQKRDLEAKVASQEDLVERGLLTRGALLNTRSQLSSTMQQIAGQDQAEARLERQLEELENNLALSSEVSSPYPGRVLELMVDPGNMVAPGTRLLTLEALEGPIDAVVYIPATDGKKVRPDMEVRISPSTVRSEEYGFMIGKVQSASVYPVTPEGMSRVLRNRDLVESLTGEGPQIEVVVSLIEDGATESGFRWSSSAGPPTQVFTGTICTALVVVETKRPASYVIPIFKESLGLS